MNHSGAAGVPRGGGLRRAHWVVFGVIALCLLLVGGVLLYLSPVLALLDNHDLSPGKPLATSTSCIPCSTTTIRTTSAAAAMGRSGSTSPPGRSTSTAAIPCNTFARATATC